MEQNIGQKIKKSLESLLFILLLLFLSTDVPIALAKIVKSLA
jgi:hypothetical protein